MLDPSAGSGTTNLAAKLLNRNSIAYEINPKYVEVIRERFNPSQANRIRQEINRSRLIRSKAGLPVISAGY